MSQENVEVVKAALDAWPQGLDALSEHWTDDIDHPGDRGRHR